MVNKPSNFCCFIIHDFLKIIARSVVVFVNTAEVENHRNTVLSKVIVITSVIKPIIQRDKPIISRGLEKRSTFFPEVIAARPAHIVTNTQSPPNVQVKRNHQNLVFMTLKRLSLPSLLTLRNKNEPSLIAQIVIKEAIIMDLRLRSVERATR